MIRVSVIIPTRNAAPWVGEALHSVIAQSLPATEIIVVDNASSDATCAVVEELQNVVPQLALVRNARDFGPGASRNIGMARATGEWLAFLDADDWFAPTRLERLTALGESTGARIVADNQIFTHGPGKPTIRTLVPSNGGSYEWIGLEAFLRRDRFVGMGTLGLMKPVFRRDFVEAIGARYDEDAAICIGEDSLFYLSCLIGGEPILLTDEPLYFYRRHPGSLSHRVNVAGLQVIKSKNADLLARVRVGAEPRLAAAIDRRITDCDDMIAFREVIRSWREQRWYDFVRELYRRRGRTLFLLRRAARGILERIREASCALR